MNKLRSAEATIMLSIEEASCIALYLAELGRNAPGSGAIQQCRRIALFVRFARHALGEYKRSKVSYMLTGQRVERAVSSLPFDL